MATDRQVTLGAWPALRASARRECAYLRSSRWDLALVTWIPWLLLGVIMAALSAGLLRHLPIAVVDLDRSADSRALIRSLQASPGLQVAATPVDLPAAWSEVRAGKVYAVVYIPRDAARQVQRGDSATVFAFYNASYLTAGQAAAREIAAAVQAQNGATGTGRAQYVVSGTSVAPVQVQSSVLFNAAKSYQHFLGGLMLPGILHIALALAAVAALGRELRDGSAPAWLAACGGRMVPAVLGKLAPYLLLFAAYLVAAVFWTGYLRGNGVAGSVALLALGGFTLCLACGAFALLLVGLTRNMGSALSLVGVTFGMAVAFSGGTFPVTDGARFAQVWSDLLPFTAYVKLQMQQVDMGVPWAVSLKPLGVLLLFVLGAGLPGLRLFARAARDPKSWGLR